MSAFYKCLSSGRRVAFLATTLMILTVTWAIASQAQAPPYSLFQNSTLTGSGNTVTATQLPVITTSGTKYFNVTLLFDVAADGTLTLAPGYPQIVPSPMTIVSNFLAGNYFGPSNENLFLITVSGPGITTGGYTEWSLAESSGGSACMYPSNATWYVGPVKNIPLYTRIKNAGINTQGWEAFGLIGSQTCNFPNWDTGTLVGLAQTGNQLTISSFSTFGYTDQSTPVDNISYCKNNACGTN